MKDQIFERTQNYVSLISIFFLLVACSSAQSKKDSLENENSNFVTVVEKKKTESDLDIARKNTEIAKKNTEATAEYHFTLAQAYVAEGNPDRAIEEYRLVLMFDPNSALVYARLATEYVKKGMLSAAMESCKEALARDPDYIDARLMLAGLYSASREDEMALKQYDLVLTKDSKHEEAAVFKSQVLAESNRGIEASRFLEKFTKQNPEAVLAWYYLGRTYQSLDHTKDAIRAYQKAIALRPNFSQASLALSFLYEEKKMNTEAKKVYKELFEESQDLAAANRLATIYLKEERYKEAIPYLESIIATDPDDMNSKVKLGLLYMETKEYEKAVTLFKGILTKVPDSDRIHYYLGSLYEEMKKTDLAMEELMKIQPDSKLYSEAALHVASLKKQAGAWRAKKYIDDCISKSPNVSGFYLFKASLVEEEKDYPGAIAILEDASKRFTEDERILYYLGSLYDRQGNIDRGLEKMEQILKINPNNVDALNYLGYTWTLKGIRTADAEKVLKKAISLKPENGYVQDSWGWFLFTQGRVEEAIVELEKAAKLRPNESTILEHLADAYLRQNLREKALAKYREAVQNSEDAAARQKIEAKMNILETEIAQKEETSNGVDRKPAGH